MNKSKILRFALIILVLLLVAILVYIFLNERKSPSTAQPVNTPEASSTLPSATSSLPTSSSSTPSSKPRNYQQYDVSKEPTHQTNANDLARLASAFAERLGSYSNQSDYGNFSDLDLFMTQSMRDWAVGYVAKMRTANPYNGSYYGITTKAISADVKSFDDTTGKAEIIVHTQRHEVKEDGSNNDYSQDLRLDFVKENGQWLVDGAYWLK